METNVIVGKWVVGNLQNGVASQHVANGVKGAWMIIWSWKIHSDMGTGRGEY